MKKRSVKIITDSQMTSVGPLSVAQPLPSPALRDADPFILLHHAGPQTFQAGAEAHRIEPHPHRGFEPVTFVFRGEVLHKDTLGNAGSIGAGEVQWITSGSGIMHSEGPTENLQRTGGELELIQLWVNLPAAKKMMTPAYQELHADHIPVLQLLDSQVELRLVAGTYQEATGPAVTQSPVFAAMGSFSNSARGFLALPNMDTVCLYVLGGEVVINGEHTVRRHNLVAFEKQVGSDVEGVHFEAKSSGNFLLLAGQPLNEPVASYGPFVMNTEDEIRTAFRDFAGGKFGTLDD